MMRWLFQSKQWVLEFASLPSHFPTDSLSLPPLPSPLLPTSISSISFPNAEITGVPYNPALLPSPFDTLQMTTIVEKQ